MGELQRATGQVVRRARVPPPHLVQRLAGAVVEQHARRPSDGTAVADVGMVLVAGQGAQFAVPRQPLGDIGQDEWDQVAIVEYPGVEAFLDMGQDPDYLAATVHRTAGLERSHILATTAVIDASATAG